MQQLLAALAVPLADTAGFAGFWGGVESAVVALAESNWVYPLLFLLAFADQFFPPVPSDPVFISLVITGYTVGSPNLWLLVPAGIIGAILGNLGCYGIGYRVGTDRFKMFRTGKGLASVERTRKGLESRGLGLIVAARWIPVARIAIIMTVGAMKYPFRKFVLGSIASLTMWGLNILAIGTIFGNIPQLPPWLAVVAGIVTGLLVGMLLDRLVRWVLGRRGPSEHTATAA